MRCHAGYLKEALDIGGIRWGNTQQLSEDREPRGGGDFTP